MRLFLYYCEALIFDDAHFGVNFREFFFSFVTSSLFIIIEMNIEMYQFLYGLYDGKPAPMTTNGSVFINMVSILIHHSSVSSFQAI